MEGACGVPRDVAVQNEAAPTMPAGVLNVTLVYQAAITPVGV
jgi:hypothetical protein